MRVENHSGQRLELVLEPYASDHWLMPGEAFVVVAVGSPGDMPWSGTTPDADPFQVDHRAGSITVHVNSGRGWVEDLDGKEVECAHQRPPVAEPGRVGALGRLVRGLRAGSS
ncbi:hypothetical protein G3I71_33940 [Streptomyces sp. SID12501]|uniref:Uncharacterized protein n=2 Tax=Streptomyces sp. SID12501 TaxID=2706042 RepID=A0A6B3C257_9ACTN|nr:hypothetical protein [Streptomyces sp. SID12501]